VPEAVAARDYPAITAVNPYFKSAHHDATFALGLDILIEGMTAAAGMAAAEEGVRRGASRPSRS
jgi:hypothetical protein